MQISTGLFDIAVVLACLMLSACGQGGATTNGSPAISSAPSTASPNTISGTVNGASSVAVTLSGSAAGTANTDSNGDFAFPAVADGSYTLAPHKTGYAFTPVRLAAKVK